MPNIRGLFAPTYFCWISFCEENRAGMVLPKIEGVVISKWTNEMKRYKKKDAPAGLSWPVRSVLILLC